MSSSDRSDARGATALGVTVFAGVWLMIVGGMQFFQGLVALADDDNKIYAATPNYLFQFDITTWGWIHLIGGVLLFLTGLALMTGQTWARIVGVFLASLSIIANFLWLPYYPLWSILIIAAASFVIWGLVRFPSEVRDEL